MGAFDTSAEATAIHLALYRKLGAAGRARIAVELSDAVRQTTIAGIKRRYPAYSDEQVAQAFLEAVYGRVATK